MAVGFAAVLTAALPAAAQLADSGKGYPVIPRSLPDPEELQLARSAAPAEISGAASVYPMVGAPRTKRAEMIVRVPAWADAP